MDDPTTIGFAMGTPSVFCSLIGIRKLCLYTPVELKNLFLTGTNLTKTFVGSIIKFTLFGIV
jgi:hypothetical protein